MARKAMVKAAAYMRVSGVGQAGADKDGFPRQRSAIKRYAQQNKLELVAEYRDEGVSGVKLDRPALTDLFQHLASNGCKLVLVENADRLGRDLIVSELLLKQFGDLGVKVIAADSGTDLTVADHDPTRKLIRQVLGAVAEFQKTQLVLKLRAARDRMSKKLGRRCEGRRAYGQTEQERKLIARAKQLYRKPRGGKRLSFGKIADVLNDQGWQPRKGVKFYACTVRDIVLRAL